MYFAYRECPKLFTYLETKAVGKTGKKASRTQGFDFLSVRKKVRPSAGKKLESAKSYLGEVGAL